VALAAVAACLVGIAGAFGLARVLDTDSTATDTPASQTPDAGADPTGDTSDETTAGAGTSDDPAADAATVDGAIVGPGTVTTSVRFVPGTTDLEPGSVETLAVVADLVAASSEPTVRATVRTYSESTSAANLDLSRRQADALDQALVAAGLDPATVTASGRGRALVTTAQPIPNFVVVDPGLGVSALHETADDLSPFAIGVDPGSGQLRAEALPTLARVAAAMTADPDGRSITLAAYAHTAPDAATNEAVAARAADAAAAHLIDRYGIAPDRVQTLVLGEAAYVVPSRAAGQVTLSWGPDAATEHTARAAVASAEDPSALLRFEPGSISLTPEGLAYLDALAAAAADRGATVVVSVHSFDAADGPANQERSRRRAEAIGQRLLTGGLGPDAVRVHAEGDLPQFRADGPSIAVVTVLA
jgi:outer membrane protein OmpA-like peptidoglycan-associated protein